MKGASSIPSFSCLRPPASLAYWNSFPSLLLLLTNGIVLGAGLRYAIIRLFVHNTRQIEDLEQHVEIVEEDYHDDASPKQFIASIREANEKDGDRNRPLDQKMDNNLP